MCIFKKSYLQKFERHFFKKNLQAAPSFRNEKIIEFLQRSFGLIISFVFIICKKRLIAKNVTSGYIQYSLSFKNESPMAVVRTPQSARKMDRQNSNECDCQNNWFQSGVKIRPHLSRSDCGNDITKS